MFIGVEKFCWAVSDREENSSEILAPQGDLGLSVYFLTSEKHHKRITWTDFSFRPKRALFVKSTADSKMFQGKQ
jgi:hypothetical protein